MNDRFMPESAPQVRSRQSSDAFRRRHQTHIRALATGHFGEAMLFWPLLRGAMLPAQSLRVLSYNVFTGPPTPTLLAGALEGSDRLRHQVEQIKSLAPDVVCLQEVQSDGVREFFETSLRDDYGATYVLTDHELRCRIGKVMRKVRACAAKDYYYAARPSRGRAHLQCTNKSCVWPTAFCVFAHRS